MNCKFFKCCLKMDLSKACRNLPSHVTFDLLILACFSPCLFSNISNDIAVIKGLLNLQPPKIESYTSTLQAGHVNLNPKPNPPKGNKNLTLPETNNSLPLKMNGWKMKFLFGS